MVNFLAMWMFCVGFMICYGILAKEECETSEDFAVAAIASCFWFILIPISFYMAATEANRD